VFFFMSAILDYSSGTTGEFAGLEFWK